MKTTNGKMNVSLVALAVQSALLAMFALPAYAQNDAVAELTKPSNTVEIGLANTSDAYSKFGEYNGLNKKGATLVGNVGLHGGDGYADGTKRFEVTGSDLGTTSRTIGAALSDQGKWSIGLGYDELTHNLSDTYQTPYQGTMGGNNFVLPAGFAMVSVAANAAPNAAKPGGTDNLSAAQLAAFNTMEIASTRKTGSVNAGMNLNAQWDVKFNFSREDRTGAKLMGIGTMAEKATSPTIQGEAVMVLPMPTNYRTDTLNLALNWVGEKAHVSTSYYGSFFSDNYDRVNFQTFAVPANGGTASMIESMTTAPSNNFHQLNVSGGYSLAAKTKLTGGLSYGLNSQNADYVYDSISMVAPPPVGSMHGTVRNSHVDLKLSDQSIDKLNLAAGLKFDERFNTTTSYMYNFNADSGQTSHKAIFPSNPISNSKTQMELSGDYRLTPDQHVKLAYNREDVKRWCHQYATGPAATPGQTGYLPAGSNCVVATGSRDDKLSAAYKLNATEDLNLNFGYSNSNRVTETDPNAITARIGVNGNVNPAATASTLVWGQNAGDFRGFYPFFSASRKEQMLKADVNWQAVEAFALGLNGKFTDDKYDSDYGVQKGNSWSWNLDATYSYSEKGSVTTYLTRQHRQRDVTDLYRSPLVAATAASATALAVPSGAAWTDTLKDDDSTVGIGAKQGGLMDSKLELATDLTFSFGKTVYGTQLNYATATTGGLTCSDPHFLTCGDLPPISNKMLQVKLIGKYQLDKTAVVTAGFIHQQLESIDYYYNGLQTGSTANSMLPTNQQSGSYSVNVVTASYSLSF